MSHVENSRMWASKAEGQGRNKRVKTGVKGVFALALPSSTNSALRLRRLLPYGSLPGLPTTTFLEAWSWSTLPMATFSEGCSWKLSYVNVPIVNHASYYLDIAYTYVVARHYLLVYNYTALLVFTTA